MDAFPAMDSFWDMAQMGVTNFTQIPDDDFLALLQKQFPSVASADLTTDSTIFDGIDPQEVHNFPSNPSPVSSDSSPSPPSTNNDASPSRRQSGVFTSPDNIADSDDPTLKRKASTESLDDEPSYKNAHTGLSANKKGNNSRRKSGAHGQDETRLLKRKEQNRAAQRAFRERKEKHVKDLEDKVAALEARNQSKESENENLRDLLQRLQQENMMLKQAAFTFSVPNGPNANFSATGSSSAQNQSHPSFNFSSPGAGPSKTPAPSQQQQQQQQQQAHSSRNNSHPFDFGLNALIPFDPAVLNMLDDSTNDDSMNLDFGSYGDNSNNSNNSHSFGSPSPYKTLASNPMFMSFAEPFDTVSPQTSMGFSSADGTSLEPWSPPSTDSSSSTTTGSRSATDSLDQLFGGNYLSAPSPVDFSFSQLLSQPGSSSPVLHKSGNTSNVDSPTFVDPCAKGECPRTKEELSQVIKNAGESTFVDAPGTAPFVRKCSAGAQSVVSCKGSKFPKTEKSEKNIEVLAAWRSITSNPQFKDIDINELCTEFTNKARCDGTKVVLEPQGVHHIIETLATRRKQQAQQ